MDSSSKNQKVPQLAGTRAQSWAEILCCGLHNLLVRSNWECCTIRDSLATGTVKGEMKGEVI